MVYLTQIKKYYDLTVFKIYIMGNTLLTKRTGVKTSLRYPLSILLLISTFLSAQNQEPFKIYNQAAIASAIDCSNSLETNPSQVLCITENRDDTTDLLISADNNIVRKTVDKNGKTLTTNTIGSLIQDSIIVKNNQVIKKLANGTVAFTKQITPSVLSRFPSINAAVEMADGTFILGGYQKFFGFPNDIPTSRDSLVLVTTDANLNYQSFYIDERNSYQGQFSMVQLDSLLQLIRLDNNRIVAIYNHGEAQLVLNNNIKFSKLLKNGATITRENINTFFSETIEGTPIFTNSCGNSLVFNTQVKAIAQKGQFIGKNNYLFDLDSLTVKSVKSVGSGSLDRYGNYNRYAYNTPIPSQNSSWQIYANYAGDDRIGIGTFQQLAIKFGNPLLAAPTHIKTIPFIQFEHIIRTGDTTCLIISTRNGELFAYNPDCPNSPPPPTTYCASKGIAPWELWVANVKFNTINNTSEKFKDFAALGNSDYTNLSTTIQKGQTYLLNITAGLSWIGNLPNAYCRTWIDWNGNNIFEDAELVFQNTNINPFEAAIRTPLSAKTGNTRMRIAMKWGSYPTACEAFDKGEVEDYAINVIEPNIVECNSRLTCPKDTIITLALADTAFCASLQGVPSINLSGCNFTPSGLFDNRTGCLKPGITPITWTMNFSSGGFTQCSYNVTIEKLLATQNDLVLNITATPSVYKQWTSTNITISVKNTGNQAFTDIKINFPFPEKMVTGGKATPSVGNWREYCAGNIKCYEWAIPTLAANSTATLDIPLFILDAVGSISATTRLLSATPTDNNAANNSATVTLNPASIAPQALARGNTEKPTQHIPLIVQQIAPNPTDGNITVELESIVEKDVVFSFYNGQGKRVKNEVRSVKKGQNLIPFNLSEVVDGLYIIQTSEGQGRFVPIKILKF
jgi:hypothetical protein